MTEARDSVEPTLEAEAARRLSAVVGGFCAYYGIGAASLSHLLMGDTKLFPSAIRAHRDGTSLPVTVGRVDRALAILAGLWPDGWPWPVGVPRPAPVALPDDKQPEVRQRLENMLAGKAREARNG